ncbi:MAG: Rpn family recombination-promoting nuclease/putative transposase [Myxococcota bacterium]
MDRLDPKLDLVFQLLLTRGEGLLRDMLQAVLGRPIAGVTIAESAISGDQPDRKQVILDIHAKLDDGSAVDIEMYRQIRVLREILIARFVYYLSRTHSNQLVHGDHYGQLRPTTLILWTVEPLFPAIDHLHLFFTMNEPWARVAFGDHLTIHVIQLSKLFSSAPSHPVGDHDRLRLWARFFMATEDAQLDQLAAEDPIMAVAVKTLDQLSQDPEICRQARTRREEKVLYQMDLDASWSEGERKGLLEGERKGLLEGKREMLLELLLEQLEQRFGPLLPATRAQIDAAASEELRAWARRVLTADNLEEVLATGC